MIPRLADNRNPASIASRFRRRRVQWLAQLLRDLPTQPRILDVGGTSDFWEQHRAELSPESRITVLNLRLDEQASKSAGIECVWGDARNMPQFQDRCFDICFSNSVIEHVGTLYDQLAMAREIRRVARGYFVQTPYRYFPVEPHFLVPGWQWLPLSVRARLIRARHFGWIAQVKDPLLARAEVEQIRLLNKRELQGLFPDGTVSSEKLGPLTKSLIAWRPVARG